MEISILNSAALSLSSHHRPFPSSLPFASSNSTFFQNPTLLRPISFPPLPRARARARARGRKGLSCTCLFGLGVPELAVIAGVAALVFGPKKLPEVGRSIGKTVKSFQQAAKEFETELKKDPGSSVESSAGKPAGNSEEEQQEVKASSTKESI